MNKYKTFSELKEELGSNYDFVLYEMGISAVKKSEQLQQENEKLKSQLNGTTHCYDEVVGLDIKIDKIIEDINFCLHSIKQEMKISKDERTRSEMTDCYKILSVYEKGEEVNNEI